MKIFSASFSITLLLTCPFIYSMDIYQKTMCLQQQEQRTMYIPQGPTHESKPQCPVFLNSKKRKNIEKDINRIYTLEDNNEKRTELTKMQERLSRLKTIAPKENYQWLDKQLQTIAQQLEALSDSDAIAESTNLQDMSKTVVLEEKFITHTQKIAQEEAQLNQIKREAEQYKRAYKDRLLRKQELLAQDAQAVLQKEQELRAELLKVQQALNTTQLQKQEFEQLLHEVQSRITVIENYTPQNSEPETQTNSTNAPLCNEPTDDLQVEMAQTEFPLLCNKQTSSTKSSLSHSCNLQ